MLFSNSLLWDSMVG